ncbi:MAG: type II toxin-antitoxin system VapC family toxin [Planctomycetes bacterium]|nr:type II toxin-antitoxin system VapC family toxin [Planctomycetota bacterium]
MTLLLDTHTILWFFWDDPKLSTVAKVAIEEPANKKVVRVASCWELAIKASLGKVTLGEPSSSFLAREIARNNFDLLPINLDHATAVETLAFHHCDPFDRMLITQSLLEQMPIVSADPQFDLYGLIRVW